MRRLLTALAGAMLLAGCVHATKTRSQDPQGKGDKKPEAEKKADVEKKPDAEKKPYAKAQAGDQTPHRSEAITTSKTTDAMFKQEGIKKLQHALSEKVKDSKALEENGKLDTGTQEALRAYQKAQKLPDTGLPDYETIRRLGVKPEDVYQHAPPAQRVGVQ